MSILSVVECRRGYEAALENARRFYGDALYLEADGRLLSAALLAVYAFDELGKAILTAKVALRLDTTAESWKQLRKDFYQHDPKIKAAQEFLNLFQGGFFIGMENLKKLADDLAKRELSLRKKVAFVD